MANILIVDDEKSVRYLLDQILKRNGHTCALAASTAEAQALLENHLFDLILLDIIMPEVSGIEMLRYLKDAHITTPVVMITGIDDPQLADKVLQQGIYDYVVKPIHKNRVIFSVNNALRRRELEDALRTHTRDTEREVVERTLSLQQTVHQLEQTQKALKERETLYREIVQSANSIILRMAPSGRISFVNDYGLRILDLENHEVVGRKIIQLFPPDPESREAGWQDLIQNISRNPTRYLNLETRYAGREGDARWIAWTNRTLLDDEGMVTEILSIGSDITQLKQQREKVQRLTGSMERMPDGICVFTDDGIIEYVNPAFERMSAFPAADLLGRSIHILGDAASPETFNARLLSRLADGRWTRGRLTERTREGAALAIEAVFSPVHDADGTVIRYVCVQRPADPSPR